MEWYEKKFTDFFVEWKKGSLCLQNGQGYFGEVETLEFADKFEDSTIRFICYHPSGEGKTFTLNEIRHFCAHSGPILSIDKYVKIVRLGEQSHLSLVERGKQKETEKDVSQRLAAVYAGLVDETVDEEEEDKVLFLVFGLEFYITEKRARALRRSARQILLSRLGNTTSLLSIKEHSPIDLTPTFTKWVLRWFGVSKSKSAKYMGKHTPNKGQEQSKAITYIRKEQRRS